MPSNSSSPLIADRVKKSLLRAIGRWGVIAESGLVAAVVAVVLLLLSPIGLAIAGMAGLVSVGVAAAISLLAAQFALVAGRLFRGPAAAMYGMVAGMFVRMAVALLVGVALQRGVPLLADAAMILYLVVFYLATLAVETGLLIVRIQSDSVHPGGRLPKAV